VLVVTQHFTPEVTAARFRVEAFVDALVGRGHEVVVVCPVPNHPQGVIQEGYRHRPLIRRALNGAEVRYVWVKTSPRKTLWTRLGYYGSFAALASAVGAVGVRPDLVLASSPPLTVGAAGALLGRRHRVPWVLDVRDIWPESAVALGELDNARAIALAERLERSLYRGASAIVTVNQAFRAWIAARAPVQRNVEVIPNGTTREWLDAGDAEVDRASVGLPSDRFVWAYAGNLGLAHGLEHAIETARLLGDGFRLLVIGDGVERTSLEARAAALPPGLVEMRGLMTPAATARHLRAADALLVSERQEHTVPSKLYDYAALRRPVVAACRGELRRVVEDEGIGIAVAHGDAPALADAVRAVRDRPDHDGGLAARQRRFAVEHLRQAQAARLAELLERVGAGRKPAQTC
jgi:glycosyltransferase involved in cell wall biosynthesis